MGAFFGNMAIKTDESDSVLEAFKDARKQAFASAPINGWTLVFPQDDFEILDLASYFSKALKTIVLIGQVFDSDDLLLNLYDNGELATEYIYDRTDGSGPKFNKGDAETFARYFSVKDSSKIHEALFEDGGDYVFIEGRYQDFLKLCQLPKALGNLWGYEYIDRASSDGRQEELRKDLPNLRQV